MSHSPAPPAGLSVLVEVSAGELIDKITILEIKRQKFRDAAKLANVATELNSLLAAQERAIAPSPQLVHLADRLRAVNLELWEIEEEIRDHERRQAFDERFIELARSVYHKNDLRAALKREINTLLNSRLVEEKSYASYAAPLDKSDA